MFLMIKSLVEIIKKDFKEVNSLPEEVSVYGGPSWARAYICDELRALGCRVQNSPNKDKGYLIDIEKLAKIYRIKLQKRSPKNSNSTTRCKKSKYSLL